MVVAIRHRIELADKLTLHLIQPALAICFAEQLNRESLGSAIAYVTVEWPVVSTDAGLGPVLPPPRLERSRRLADVALIVYFVSEQIDDHDFFFQGLVDSSAPQ